MIYDAEKIRELIPFYLNHRLSETEQTAFENALNRYPELKRELQEFAEIKEVYKNIEEEIPLPSPDLYQKVLNRLPEQKGFAWFPVKKEKRGKRAGYVKNLFLSPYVSWGVVAVQVAVILLLILHLPQREGFRTLTSRPLPGEGVKINIIFDQKAKEADIRAVLHKAGATIVLGPSLDGLYIVEVNDVKAAERALKRLNKSGIVKFAEKAY